MNLPPLEDTPFTLFYTHMKGVGIESQRELAQLLSITPQAVSDAKRRGTVPPSWAYTLSTLFEWSLEDILSLTVHELPPSQERRLGLKLRDLKRGAQGRKLLKLRQQKRAGKGRGIG